MVINGVFEVSFFVLLSRAAFLVSLSYYNCSIVYLFASYFSLLFTVHNSFDGLLHNHCFLIFVQANAFFISFTSRLSSLSPGITASFVTQSFHMPPPVLLQNHETCKHVPEKYSAIVDVVFANTCCAVYSPTLESILIPGYGLTSWRSKWCRI